MIAPSLFGRGVSRLLRTVGPFLVVVAITVAALVVYLELVALLLEVVPELAG